MAEVKDYSELKKDELQELADDRKLTYTDKNTKSDIIEMLMVDDEAEKDEKEREKQSKEPEKTTEPEKPAAPAKTEKSIAEIERDTILEQSHGTRKKIYIEWLNPRIIPPDWYYTDDFKGTLTQKTMRATPCLIGGLDGEPTLRYIYRCPENKYTKGLFDKGEHMKVLTKDDLTDELKLAIAQADQKELEGRRKHLRMMRKEGLRVGK